MLKLSLEITEKISGGMYETPDSDDYDGDPGLPDDQTPRSGSSGSPWHPPVDESDPLDDVVDDNGNQIM